MAGKKPIFNDKDFGTVPADARKGNWDNEETLDPNIPIIPLENIQPAVVEVDPRSQAERDSDTLKEAQKIRQDSKRFIAAKSIPGTPNY
jgi:hypothetical protein